MAEPAPRRRRDEVRELTDPRDLRALAHPVRLRILEVLGQHDRALTATELAEMLGESSGSTSYHLRQLAKYGFVDEATEAGSGRQRPWRKAHRGMSFRPTAGDTPGQELAARELLHVVADQYIRRIRTHLRHEPTLPDEWRAASELSDDLLHVTADELRELGRAVFDLLRPYERPDPEDRPAGSRPVSLMLFGLPVIDTTTSGVDGP